MINPEINNSGVNRLLQPLPRPSPASGGGRQSEHGHLPPIAGVVGSLARREQAVENGQQLRAAQFAKVGEQSTGFFKKMLSGAGSSPQIAKAKLDLDKVQAWMKKGALPSDRVSRFLDAAGIMKRKKRNCAQCSFL